MLIFATNNAHKLAEARAILPMSIASLSEVGIHEDIPETGVSLEENSLQKAQYVFDRLHKACFADDTGLEVDCLNGAPGYMTARYSGEPVDSTRNMLKLLAEMSAATAPLLRSVADTGVTPAATGSAATAALRQRRGAQFRTVITLIRDNGEICQVSGIVRGRIALEMSGVGGFGYDPVFIPEGYDKTFSELGEELKNHISHRARALQELLKIL